MTMPVSSRGCFASTPSCHQTSIGSSSCKRLEANGAALRPPNLWLVRARQEFVRLHLQQPAQGTLELEAQAPTGIQVL